ncbi:MAG: hypothetical protein HYR96_07855 [Deltaproteobacteria bacterium]|nr:hypothetical protein [Deltaproteobacteria bacterium]
MKNWKNNQGISIIELTVGAVISAFFVMAFASFMKMSVKTQAGLNERLDAISSDLAGSALISHDLSASGSSFDLLSVPSDTNSNFYDYTPEQNCSNCERSMTLTPTNGKSFVMVDDVSRLVVGSLPLNPVPFYDLVTNPTATVSGTLAFNATKFKTTLEGLGGGAFNLTQDNQNLLFYSPVRLRPAGTTTPPKVVAFLGVMKGGAVTASSFTGLAPQRHPATLKPFDTADTFFRSMPNVAGNGAFAFVKAVQPVRYTMDTVRTTRGVTGRLLRVQRRLKAVQRKLGRT